MAKMEKHFVSFYFPGVIVSESTERPIDSWDIDAAKAMAREMGAKPHGVTPYAFRFSTRTRTDEDLDSKVTATSPNYFLGGKVETLAEVKARATENDRILVGNMEGNHYERIITNTNSWRVTMPVAANDVVLEWP